MDRTWHESKLETYFITSTCEWWKLMVFWCLECKSGDEIVNVKDLIVDYAVSIKFLRLGYPLYEAIWLPKYAAPLMWVKWCFEHGLEWWKRCPFRHPVAGLSNCMFCLNRNLSLRTQTSIVTEHFRDSWTVFWLNFVAQNNVMYFYVNLYLFCRV